MRFTCLMCILYIFLPFVVVRHNVGRKPHLCRGEVDWLTCWCAVAGSLDVEHALAELGWRLIDGQEAAERRDGNRSTGTGRLERVSSSRAKQRVTGTVWTGVRPGGWSLVGRRRGRPIVSRRTADTRAAVGDDWRWRHPLSGALVVVGDGRWRRQVRPRSTLGHATSIMGRDWSAALKQPRPVSATTACRRRRYHHRASDHRQQWPCDTETALEQNEHRTTLMRSMCCLTTAAQECGHHWTQSRYADAPWFKNVERLGYFGPRTPIQIYITRLQYTVRTVDR